MVFLLAPLLTSLDSLLGSLALGPYIASGRRRIGLACAFGICDALATGVGARLGPMWLSAGAADVMCRALIISYATVVFTFLGSRWRQRESSSWLIWTIPVLMSFDNLLETRPGSLATISICVVCSACASWLGFRLADVAWLRVEHKASSLSTDSSC